MSTADWAVVICGTPLALAAVVALLAIVEESWRAQLVLSWLIGAGLVVGLFVGLANGGLR